MLTISAEMSFSPYRLSFIITYATDRTTVLRALCRLSRCTPEQRTEAFYRPLWELLLSDWPLSWAFPDTARLVRLAAAAQDYRHQKVESIESGVVTQQRDNFFGATIAHIAHDRPPSSH